MRFLDSWTQLPPDHLMRWVPPVGFMVLLVGTPGRVAARLGTTGVALSLALDPEMLGPGRLRLAWIALWVLISWGIGGGPRLQGPSSRERRLGHLETGTVGFILGLALLALLIVAIARQDLPPDPGRRASYGILVMSLGILHLMLRRHTVRAAIGVAMLGLGLQVIEQVARDALIPSAPEPRFGILLATTLGCALAVRAGRTRERVATSPWVGDAHDLRD